MRKKSFFEGFLKIFTDSSTCRRKCKHPHERPLRAEPLEERLPVSSSILGVVAGAGVAAAYGNSGQAATYAEERTYRTSADTSALEITFDSLEITSLTAIDPFNVDRLISEEETASSGGTSSAVNYGTRSISITDSTSILDAVLSDALNDPLDATKAYGNEIHLTHLANSNSVTQQFSPLQPEISQPISGVSATLNNELDDETEIEESAFLPPSAYGFSELADELDEDEGDPMQMSCGCGGCGCGGGNEGDACYFEPHILIARVNGGCGSHAQYSSCTNGEPHYTPVDDPTAYAVQYGNSASFTATGSGCSLGGSVQAKVYVKSPGGYWNNTHQNNLIANAGTSFTWTKPINVTNDTAQRSFVFTFYMDKNYNGIHDAGESSVDLNVYVGYAEVQVAFAGRAANHAGNVKGDKTDQTQNNTVIVGQKVEATLECDPLFTVHPTFIYWDEPIGGSFVKDYDIEEEDDSSAEIIYHDTADYQDTLLFEYYYTNKSSSVGSIRCGDMELVDPNGYHHYISASSSFYIETAVCTSVSPLLEGVSVSRYSPGGDQALMLGNMDDMGIDAHVKINTPIFGAGHWGYAQIGTDSAEYRKLGNNENTLLSSASKGPALDYSHPLKWHEDIPAAQPVAASVSGAQMGFEDKPGIFLSNLHPHCTYIEYEASFEFYVIYKPSGESIWVTLAQMDWRWDGYAYDDPNKGWEAGIPDKKKEPTATWNRSSELPTWDSVYRPTQHVSDD